jgi:competence protein ComEC
VIASLATAPFALFQFNRVATFGIVANLIAVPLTAFWIMPLGLLGLLVLPFGLAGPCFVLMGRGIELVLVVAATVAEWPWAAARIASPPDAALVLTVLGGLWLCLWRRPWRRLGLIGPALALALMLVHQPPDVLMDRTGRLAAVRLDDGRLAIAPWERDRWVTDGWLRRSGQDDPAPWPAEGASGGQGLACDALGCILSRGGWTVALARRGEALEDDCARADLVLSYPYLERCPGGTPLIGPRALREAQGLSLRLTPAGIHIRTTHGHRGARPWVR